MLLKTFQATLLDTVSLFGTTLATHLGNRQKLESMAAAQGIPLPPANVGSQAWEAMRAAGKLPLGAPGWLERRDPMKREIFSACLKVPTGGGKTLIGAHAVGRLMTALHGRRTGLVVWFVPSEAIYRQTLRAFAKPGHPYRVALENAANGHLKVLDKRSQISRNDLDNSLCVLVVMLQATVREQSEVLRIFRDSGAFQGVFPSVEDKAANDAMRSLVPNLDVLGADDHGIPGISVRHSLANLLRCERPLFVIDEGHRAYTDLARQSLNDLNPSFVLELTATPDTDGHHSNVLASVSGVDLKDAELIKLPISLNALIGQTWQRAVKSAMDLRDELEKKAVADSKVSGRYVRPIVLVRAEATGARKPGKTDSRIHVDDVKDYLVSKLKIRESWIRLKTASVNEIEDEDLLDQSCPVRVILTKDALREGWDCSFAYVLVVLSVKTGKTAVTQMTGRVLRQPYAKLANTPELNESYVVCVTEDVQQAVKAVCDGLQQEGMADAGTWVKTKGVLPVVRKSVSRSSVLSGDFLLPVVSIKSGASWVPFHPERNLLPLIDWKTIPVPDISEFVAVRDEQSVSVSLGLRSVGGRLAFDVDDRQVHAVQSAPDAYVPAVEVMRAVVPNAWVALDMLRAAESQRLSAGVKPEQLPEERMLLARFLAGKLGRVLDKLLEAKFLELCKAGSLKLVASAKSGVGVLVPPAVEVVVSPGDLPIRRADGTPLLKNLLAETYQSEVNSLELASLRHIDQAPATSWWWRVPVRGNWGLQGWRQDAVYPDFVAYATTGGRGTLLAIETKGAHLVGNPDTAYKKALLTTLKSYYTGTEGVAARGKSTPAGVAFAFEGMVLEETSWQTELAAVLPPPAARASATGPIGGSGGTPRRRSGPARRTS